MALIRFVSFSLYLGVSECDADRWQTIVNCTEANEAFHAQCGFVREGSQMVLQNVKKAVEGYV